MLHKLRNLQIFLIPYLATTFKPIKNCKTKRKGSFLAGKIQEWQFKFYSGVYWHDINSSYSNPLLNY